MMSFFEKLFKNRNRHAGEKNDKSGRNNAEHEEKTAAEVLGGQETDDEMGEWSLPEDTLKRMIKTLLESSYLDSPDSTPPRPFYVVCKIPNTDQFGFLWIELRNHDPEAPLLFRISVVREGTNLEQQFFMKKGNREEIKEYLTQEENFRKIYNGLHILSAEYDD